LLSHCPLKFGGLGGGFAPRQFNRWARRGEIIVRFWEVLFYEPEFSSGK